MTVAAVLTQDAQGAPPHQVRFTWPLQVEVRGSERAAHRGARLGRPARERGGLVP